MKSIYHKPQELARSLLLLLLGLILCGAVACSAHHEREAIAIDTTSLRPGSLILRRGEGMLSTFFSKIASEGKLYSHCGIIDYDSTGQCWVVWHAYQDSSIGADGIFCQSLDSFVMESEAVAIYPALALDSLGLQRMRAYIALHRPGAQYPKRFDSHFDLRDTTTLYCTEFVALAYCATELPAYQVQPTGHNVAVPYTYYTLDDLIKTVNPLQIQK
ncbi:YiiX/YebB-like N1pC/P60 family cysteine hydrolase [uncultured Porphyromonas sp.]|uniref:YiiX/YebB-like N1pC/P60 family cysteine hydrolase n=1 Tax=uncultured Porphyromonas sp. TaxID=159274 RepID=UPI002608C83F|nr:YiiX/YebB-like N1pC/P60 family cysteine hydrolase [uncultured Porphyromonas sp.]